MYRLLLFVCAVTFIFPSYVSSQGRNSTGGHLKQLRKMYPHLPIISAYDAYVKYKSGKAILINAGGEAFDRRRIMGSIRVHGESVRLGKIRFPALPRKGVYILVYCY